MKFRKKPVVVEANKFSKRGECPIGVRTREDGSNYVVTIHGQETNIEIGDWIILEPTGDGTQAYPCKPEVFEATYDVVQ